MLAELVLLLACSLCGVGTLLVVVIVVMVAVGRSAGRSEDEPPAGATFFPSLGLSLSLPKCWEAEDVGGEIRVRLPSSYTFSLAPGDGPGVLAKRARWLEETPYRNQATVIRHDERVFFYSASEDGLPDISFVAWSEAGGQTWLVETHGAIVEHETLFSPADEAEKGRLQQQLAQAMQSGEAMDGPVVQDILDRIGALAAEAAQSAPEPKTTLMSQAECEAAIRMVLSLREA